MADTPSPVVADTHAFIWYVQADPRLSDCARTALRSAVADGSPVFVSAATVVELRYLVEKGKITEDEFRWYMLMLESSAEAIEVTPVDTGVARAVEVVPRGSVPDPFDRMIAATAAAIGIPLVTADRKLRELQSVKTVW